MSSAVLLMRYDEQQVDTAVIYDITAQAATSLGAAIIACRSSATTVREREHWSMRLRGIDQTRVNLNPVDRGALVAQMQRWVNEAESLLVEVPGQFR